MSTNEKKDFGDKHIYFICRNEDDDDRKCLYFSPKEKYPEECKHRDPDCDVCQARERYGKCTWTNDTDGDAPVFSCSCGQCITFNDDGPKENEYRFCPFCGREIELEEKRG